MEENLERFIEGFNSSPHLCFIIQCASAERKLLGEYSLPFHTSARAEATNLSQNFSNSIPTYPPATRSSLAASMSPPAPPLFGLLTPRRGRR